MNTAQHTSYRRRTTEDVLRQKQLSAPRLTSLTSPNDGSGAPDTKRQRTLHNENVTVAPDLQGTETAPSQPWGSTPGPYSNVFSSIPPRPPSACHQDSTDPLSLSHRKWGLGVDVVAGMKACRIEKMYPWQNECLSLPGVLEGEKNLVYAAPTSAGKSLVAELLMIKKVVGERRKAVIVVPYISIVQEKTMFLKKCLEGIRVQELRIYPGQPARWRPLNIVGFHSGTRSRNRWKEIDTAICTIEKANMLVNGAIEERSIDDLGLIIFDELHMVDDNNRGFILELLASKLLCIANTQIVGMSATLSNIQTLGQWLKAQVYECNYRPIPLEEHLVYDNSIYSHHHTVQGVIPVNGHKALANNAMTNAIINLTLGAVCQDHGVLIFCESRRRCEDLSQLLMEFMPPVTDPDLQDNRIDIVGKLATTVTGLDGVMRKTVPIGIAFHHAGLTTEERDIITDAYNDGLIKVIFCTATMAAGVNLPARRVIISPRMGRDFVSAAMLRQMRGRAGRKGWYTHGETYVCCRKEDVSEIKKLLIEELPEVKSCLVSETESSRLSRALLEIVSTRLATSLEGLEEFLHSTLLHYTHPEPTKLPTLLRNCLKTLEDSGLIENPDDDDYRAATKMGNATVSAGLTPEDGLFMHQELSRALRQFNLETDMHIVYQFTPIHATSSAGIDIDWKLLRDSLERLDEPSLRAATFVGVSPAFIHKLAQGGVFHENTPTEIARARVYRRFYISLMLRALINEKPMHVVAREFGVAHGFVQSLASTCRGFAGTSGTYCKVMGWTGLGVLLEHYSWRLDLGVKDDLMSLARLPFVKSTTARVFCDMGLKSVELVAKAGIEKVVDAIFRAQPKIKGPGRGREGEKIAMMLKMRAEVIIRAAQKLWEQEYEEE